MRIMKVGGIVFMNFKDLEKILTNDGWVLKGIKGSHYQYIHSWKKGKVTIPRHGKSDLNIKTVKTILKLAGCVFN